MLHHAVCCDAQGAPYSNGAPAGPYPDRALEGPPYSNGAPAGPYQNEVPQGPPYSQPPPMVPMGPPLAGRKKALLCACNYFGTRHQLGGELLLTLSLALAPFLGLAEGVCWMDALEEHDGCR